MHAFARHRQRSSLLRRPSSTATALALPVALAAGLAAWGLADPSMNGVEAVTFYAAHLPASSFARLMHHVDVVHGTYYAGIHVLFAVLGRSPLVMRLPSAVGGVAAVLLTGVLTRRVTGSDRTAFLAATVLAVNPVLSAYAGLGRSYALVSAIVVGLTLLLLRAVRTGSAWAWWAYTAVATTVVYLHEFAVLVLAAHGVTLLWSRVPWRVLLRHVAQAVAALVLASPVIVASVGQADQVGYLQPPDLQSVVLLVRDYFGPTIWVCGVALLLAALSVVTGRTRAAGVTLTRVAVPLLVVAPALLMLESRVATPLFAGVRYVLFGTAAAAMLVGGGLDALSRRVVPSARRVPVAMRALGAAVAVAALLLAQGPTLRVVHSVAGRDENLLAAAREIRRYARPGDGVVYAPRPMAALDLGYPRDLRGVLDVEQAETNLETGTLYGSLIDGYPYVVALLHRPRIWFVTRPGRSVPGLDGARALLCRHGYRMQRRARATGIVVELFARPGRGTRARPAGRRIRCGQCACSQKLREPAAAQARFIRGSACCAGVTSELAGSRGRRGAAGRERAVPREQPRPQCAGAGPRRRLVGA